MPEFLRRVLVHNAGIKVISVLLATLLWVAVARDPIAEVEMRVPIEFRNLPDNLEIDSASFTEAQLRVRGPERLIHRLQPGEIRAEVDLHNVQPGDRTFDLNNRQIHVPEDVQVVQIIPGQFHLSFDVRETRTVEIRPRVTGNFASGVHVEQTIADPPSVLITGPRRHVQAVEAATTDPVDVSGTMTRATFVTHAYVTDPLIQIMHPASVRVTVIMSAGEQKNNQ